MIEDWGSYRVADFIPYSSEALAATLSRYNTECGWVVACWLVLNAGWLGAWASRPDWRAVLRPLAGLLLVGAWLWTGWAWHAERFAVLQPGAPVLAALFLLQALLIAGLWWWPAPAPEPQPTDIIRQRTGLILYGVSALVPVSACWHGSLAPVTLFGWGSCTTAAGTLGLVLALHRGWRRAALLVLPVLVCSYELLAAWGLLSRTF